VTGLAESGQGSGEDVAVAGSIDRKMTGTSKGSVPENVGATGSPSDREARRQCPWCDSADTRLVQRGLTGPTDERDQYIVCKNCQRITYEILSRSNRDMRVSQFRAGSTVRDNASQTKYTINRVLKVGVNEYLLYVKPITRRESPDDEAGLRFR